MRPRSDRLEILITDEQGFLVGLLGFFTDRRFFFHYSLQNFEFRLDLTPQIFQKVLTYLLILHFVFGEAAAVMSVNFPRLSTAGFS